MSDRSTALTDEEQERLNLWLGNPIFFPSAFKDYIAEKVRTEVGAKLPVAQARKSNVLFGHIATSPTLVLMPADNSVWKDTSPPHSITLPGPGQAMVFFTVEASHQDSNLDNIQSAIWVNGTEVTPDQRTEIRAFQKSEGGARGVLVDLPDATNTVTLRHIKFGSAQYVMHAATMLAFRIEL